MKNISPSHEEIAQRAYKIWQERGSPQDRDAENWFEAERQLTAGSPASDAGSSSQETSSASESKGAAGAAERTKSEAPAEPQRSPAPPNEQENLAELQKRQARAPQSPTHTAPKAKPAETGKPLWNTPHSS